MHYAGIQLLYSAQVKFDRNEVLVENITRYAIGCDAGDNSLMVPYEQLGILGIRALGVLLCFLAYTGRSEEPSKFGKFPESKESTVTFAAEIFELGRTCSLPHRIILNLFFLFFSSLRSRRRNPTLPLQLVCNLP